jgi:hypothetical protein
VEAYTTISEDCTLIRYCHMYVANFLMTLHHDFHVIDFPRSFSVCLNMVSACHDGCADGLQLVTLRCRKIYWASGHGEK